MATLKIPKNPNSFKPPAKLQSYQEKMLSKADKVQKLKDIGVNMDGFAPSTVEDEDEENDPVWKWKYEFVNSNLKKAKLLEANLKKYPIKKPLKPTMMMHPSYLEDAKAAFYGKGLGQLLKEKIKSSQSKEGSVFGVSDEQVLVKKVTLASNGNVNIQRRNLYAYPFEEHRLSCEYCGEHYLINDSNLMSGPVTAIMANIGDWCFKHRHEAVVPVLEISVNALEGKAGRLFREED